MGESMWRRPVTELSSYPTELDAHVTLTDQRRIRIRALHRREERPIRVLHERLSPRTRYLRFLSPIPTLPDALVRRLACVDYRRRLAVVAEDEAAGGAGVVALGTGTIAYALQPNGFGEVLAFFGGAVVVIGAVMCSLGPRRKGGAQT